MGDAMLRAGSGAGPGSPRGEDPRQVGPAAGTVVRTTQESLNEAQARRSTEGEADGDFHKARHPLDP